MVVLACGSAALALVLACVGFAWYGVSNLLDAKGRQLRDRSEIMAFQAGPAIALRDRERATEILSSLQTDPTIEEARIYGRDRKIIATWGQQRTMMAPVYNPRGYRFIGYHHVEVLRPLVVGKQRLGTVYIRANTSDLKADLVDLVRIACYLLALAMLVVFFISMRLQRAISRPIVALTTAAQQISQSADASIRVETEATAELQTLQDAFNRMLDRIQESEQALQAAHGDLENRVLARTEELSEEVARRKETQDDLEAAKEVAEAASRAKTEFLANMSHEIRTPLNGILGFTELMLTDRQGLPDAERVEYLRTIRKSGSHLCALINDILDISKIEAGRFELERIACSPREIIDEVAAVLRVRAAERGLSLDCDTNKLPETVESDPARLRQLLMNLVGNAVKFTERGGVRIIASYQAERLQIEVADTGVGISDDKLEAIFDPFSQADNSVTRRFGGTGLGLAISRKICEALGGDLSVQSELGVGSVFTASITAPPADSKTLPAANVPRQSEPESRPDQVDLSGRKILVVDDGETNRKLIQLILKRAGAEVVVAENGLEATRAAETDLPDCILMDMQMPVMDGYAATRKLRAAGNKSPIIALTAHAMKGDEERCLEAGCSDYLTKPVDAEDVLAMVSQWLPKTPQSAVVDPYIVVEPVSVESEPVRLCLRSTLPLDDVEFCEIVIDFVERLQAQLVEMQRLHAAGDSVELAQLAHWLKGAGGTAGFHDLTEPARGLELAALDNDSAIANHWLKKIEDIASRIELPQLPADASASASL